MTTELSEKEIYFKLKASALRLLVRRDHSTAELKAKLSRKPFFSHDLFKALIEELRSLRYLIDEQVLADRLASGWQFQGKGQRYIQLQLKKRGLPQAQVVSHEAQLEAAKRFLEKKFRGITPKTQTERAKVARSLASRGFSTTVVATVLNQARRNQ
ncbi:MAG: regulatory protein RecX [Oligoflexia bacterium]|nr:regulatory protein RecX [Oligoflexia bacterium]